MGLCRERDAKRKLFEAEAAKKKKVPVAVAPPVKPKARANFVKPLSYEELMKKAEVNSKNTLSVADLKASMAGEPVKPDLKRIAAIPKQNVSRHAAMKQHPSSTVSTAKKPVKVIKRNMQPRNETADLVILNQNKRDLRSIEEIQMQLKQQHQHQQQQQQQKKMQSKPKPKQNTSEDEDPETYYAKNYSSIISGIFGYDRNKYVGKDEGDDELLDMEADYRTVIAEEARSTRIGKQEDLREELKEIERKKKKASLLKS